MVVVTHDRALLSDVAETAPDPTPDDRVRVYGNGYAGYREGRRRRARTVGARIRATADRARAVAGQSQLGAEPTRLGGGDQRREPTSTDGPRARAGFVQSVHRRQEQLEAHAVTVPEPPQVFRFPELATRTGAVLLSVEDVTVTGRFTRPHAFTATAGVS